MPLVCVFPLELKPVFVIDETPTIHNVGWFPCSRGGLTPDDSMALLARMPKLSTLDLSMSDRLTDKGAQHLGAAYSLTDLNLFKCKQLQDGAMASIARLHGLRALNLSSCYLLTGAGTSCHSPLLESNEFQQSSESNFSVFHCEFLNFPLSPLKCLGVIFVQEDSS